MKNAFILCMSFFVQISWSQSDTFIVNNTSFVMVKQTKWREGYRDTLVKLFRMDTLKHSQYLLTHYIYQKNEDCNNVYEDVGSYLIEQNKIIFITDYYQKRNDPMPIKRKQIYQVMADGKIFEIYDKQLVPWTNEWEDTNE